MLKKLKKLKKAKQICILFLVITLNVALSSAGQTTEPFEVRRAEAVFEELPVPSASEILRPEILAGPHHKVREPVPTYFGANQFTIDSDFGVFEAKGNEMLVHRIKEINAIAQLKDVSRTDEYQKALIESGKNRSVFVALSGQVSPRLRQELETRGFTVQDRLAPGPLK
jgi:hypothetical protein